ncbi:NHL repeat-containing protein [Niabella drilacis]|uniref:NHL repeat-containing protein n=1 Tax=Niabella drilacis (strain DSM 25811 / CCM 8410 / CCUG 62505 / LMG 26954 / E90) TaxID=1285928 RepID=A0A1G6MSJ9_NIADE|nr:hypothetical protein [Niabella drilacis]SDC58530.1 NHL repeat-containing protein [Niabella drilacis]
MIKNYCFSKLAICLALVFSISSSRAQVSTLAGGAGNVDYVDAVGTAARMGRMSGNMVCDGKGNLYFADFQNWRIRKVRLSDGTVTTVTGSGPAGYVNGTLSEAKFYSPRGLAIDAAGEILYVSDRDCIRKIDLVNGVVSIVAGQGGSIQGSYQDGIGTAARFNGPYGLALDGAGNLFVADQQNNRVRKIRLSDAEVTTVAGRYVGSGDGQGTSGRFSAPGFLVYDGSGYLYVSDQNNHRIRSIRLSDAMVETVAGSSAGFADGSGTAAQFNYPSGLALDHSGNLYVGDYSNRRVRMVKLSSKDVTTLTGSAYGFVNGSLQQALFSYVTSLVFDEDGNLYVGDETNYAIRKIATGVLPVHFGTVQAAIKNETLYVSWQTLAETNSAHFLIQASDNGQQFTTIQTIQSKATAGNSNSALTYSSAIPLSAISISAGLLLLGVMANGRRRYAVTWVGALLCMLSFSCSRKGIITGMDKERLLVRIVQVDKDGKEQVSKVVSAVREQ